MSPNISGCHKVMTNSLAHRPLTNLTRLFKVSYVFTCFILRFRGPGTNVQTRKLYHLIMSDSMRIPAALAKFKHMVLAKRERERESCVWCGVTGILVIHVRSCEHSRAHDVSPVLKWPEKQGTVLLQQSQKLLEMLETQKEFLQGTHGCAASTVATLKTTQNQTPPHVPAHCNAHLLSDTMDILEIELGRSILC